ncbi:MAG: hypothetical protein AAF827_08500 [Cyanobacteria bacterium P01_D01_bin.6]
MPEEINSSDIPPSPEEAPEATAAEWTDDSIAQPLEIPTSTGTTSSATNEQDEAVQDCDDEAVVTAAEFAEAEWTDDTSYQTLETSTAETDIASSTVPERDEAPQGPENAAESTEAEWTDDSSYQTLETPVTETDTVSSATDEWDEAIQEWDDELAELPEPAPQTTTTKEALSWIQPAWQKFRRLWQRLIVGVRNRIPAATKLSDSALSGILVGILVLLLMLLNSVRQPSVGASPTSLAPTEVPALDAGDVDRIAQIQTQMTDSSILNAQRVIDSVQADFRQNQLTLVFNGDWYRLSDYDQTQLAQALMQQSQELAFTDLELVTSTSELLARSPVVGNNMVILQREQTPEVPKPERPRYRLTIDR